MIAPCNNTSVGILVARDDPLCLLLIERRKFPYGFAPPAGHVDPGEDYPDAAKRELHEEVGLDATGLRMVLRTRRDNRCRRPGGDHHEWQVYGATSSGTPVLEPDEVRSLLWAGPGTLHALAAAALLDAWGMEMIAVGEELAALPEEQRPAHVIFAVVTDGAENASQEWSRQQVFDRVREQTEKWGWTFLFIAANQDAVTEGAKYGVPAGQTVTYAHDPAGTRAAFGSTSSVISRARSGKGAVFTEAERQRAQGRGPRMSRCSAGRRR